MSLLEASNTITAGPEYSKIAEAQKNTFQIAFMDMREVLKEKNEKKILKEIHENTNKQWEEMKKSLREIKKNRNSNEQK